MRLFWFSFRGRPTRRSPRGRKWRVFLVDDAGPRTDGWSNLRKREILVLARERARIVEVTAHELTHAMIDRFVASEREHRAEERIARRVESSFWPVVASLGATFPPFPKGYRQLRASARRKAA